MPPPSAAAPGAASHRLAEFTAPPREPPNTATGPESPVRRRRSDFRCGGVMNGVGRLEVCILRRNSVARSDPRRAALGQNQLDSAKSVGAGKLQTGKCKGDITHSFCCFPSGPGPAKVKHRPYRRAVVIPGKKGGGGRGGGGEGGGGRGGRGGGGEEGFCKGHPWVCLICLLCRGAVPFGA